MGKMIHIAWYCATEEDKRQLKSFFGLENAEWVQDHVDADVKLYGPTGEISGVTVMDLEFNYDLGVELEIQTFLSGPNLYQPRLDAGETCFQSHHGIKLEDDEPFPEVGFPLLLEVRTLSHTNPFLVDAGRTAHYRMYRSPGGHPVEYIKRVYNK
jgi:hypothetical protein